jgi:hypothetical protein
MINILKHLLLFLFTLLTFAQTLTGTVKDTLGAPLQNANVIAKPLVDNKKTPLNV